MAKESILIVEDEKDLVKLIRYNLEKEGYRVFAAHDGEAGLALFRKEKPDLIILDIMLPRVDGYEFCKIVRQDSRVPIIMLTAKTEEVDRVLGLELGADDYVTKPFEIPVVLARVRALLRRAKGEASGAAGAKDGLLRLEGLTLDPSSHSVTLDGQELTLTRYEFRLLQALMQNAGRVLTRESLIDQVQGTEVSVIDRAIDTHVFGLRKKLGAAADLIETVRGVGYRVRA
jgi:DNA-binding response OmpR family regulator